MRFKIGDKVIRKDDYYVGTITKTYNRCPMTNKWLKALSKPIKAEAVRGVWFEIVGCDGDKGSICVPACNIELYHDAKESYQIIIYDKEGDEIDQQNYVDLKKAISEYIDLMQLQDEVLDGSAYLYKVYNNHNKVLLTKHQ